jgi:WhiB family transcriptional regulator, redox-sensing transcriptional regulator
MTTDTNWRDDAACLDANPDLFFPMGTTGSALNQINEAMRSCLTCPVWNVAWRGRWGWAPPPASGEARPGTSGGALRRAAARRRDRARRTALHE